MINVLLNTNGLFCNRPIRSIIISKLFLYLGYNWATCNYFGNFEKVFTLWASLRVFKLSEIFGGGGICTLAIFMAGY